MLILQRDTVEVLVDSNVSSRLYSGAVRHVCLGHALLTADELNSIVQQSELTQQAAADCHEDLLSSMPPMSPSAGASNAAQSLYSNLTTAIVYKASKWQCKAPVGVIADVLETLTCELTDSVEGSLDELLQLLVRAAQDLEPSTVCAAHSGCSELAQMKLTCVISAALDRVPHLQSQSCTAGTYCHALLFVEYAACRFVCDGVCAHVLHVLVPTR